MAPRPEIASDITSDISPEIATRVEALPWDALLASLDRDGFAVVPALLSPAECQALAARYEGTPVAFRSRILMQRYAFGQGEYQYFAYPLPEPIASLRAAFYPPLARLANTWQERLGQAGAYPESLAAYLARCHAAGQLRPTALLLKYGPGDYNCLHQDLYGELQFPIQLTLQLSRPGLDFTGGEFVLVEQRPRMQSRARVVSLAQGEAVLFAVNKRPVAGKRGYYGVSLRHGVSALHGGQRFSAGIIFHDAR